MVSTTINKDDSERIAVIFSCKRLRFARLKAIWIILRRKEVKKTKSKPVLSFVEGLVLTRVRNNRNIVDIITICRG